MITNNVESKNKKVQLLDHEYDGIRELDNMLPRWWVWLFYATIVFSIWYAAYYMAGYGLTTQEELSVSLERIESLKPPPLASGEDSVSAIVAALGNNKNIHEGREVYEGKCVACHGKSGEGGIGPNLTDDYWISGQGRIQDLVEVIANGVAEKGMPPWADVLSREEFRDVVVFVRSLHASSPANSKAPQGEKYEFKD